MAKKVELTDKEYEQATLPAITNMMHDAGDSLEAAFWCMRELYRSFSRREMLRMKSKVAQMESDLTRAMCMMRTLWADLEGGKE